MGQFPARPQDRPRYRVDLLDGETGGRRIDMSTGQSALDLQAWVMANKGSLQRIANSDITGTPAPNQYAECIVPDNPDWQMGMLVLAISDTHAIVRVPSNFF